MARIMLRHKRSGETLVYDEANNQVSLTLHYSELGSDLYDYQCDDDVGEDWDMEEWIFVRDSRDS